MEVQLSENVVHCEVAFDRIEHARRKLDEIANVMKCIKSSGEIDFTFSPRVHISK